MTSRIALGTVQFGLSYGVANTLGQVTCDEAASILAAARSAGLDTLDTAISYGESETRLGEIGVAEWRLVSKLPPLPAECGDVAAWVRDQVDGSLRRLGIQALGGVLLHRSADLLTEDGRALYEAMCALREYGTVQKIGVSVYDPEELDLLAPHYRFDLVQAPFNVIDRRLASSGWMERLRTEGVEMHTRSAFLQGLLLMPKHRRPPRFRRWQTIFDRWDDWLESQAIDPVRACLSFALAHAAIDRVIVGVDTLGHLQAILESVGSSVPEPPDDLASHDIDLINPSRWAAR